MKSLESYSRSETTCEAEDRRKLQSGNSQHRAMPMRYPYKSGPGQPLKKLPRNVTRRAKCEMWLEREDLAHDATEEPVNKKPKVQKKQSEEVKAVPEKPLKQRELDPTRSKALDEELQQLMVKVWQELPDNPQSDADREVAQKFRNEAGDELKNIIGLNVTKRLLNIYNGIYVKVNFNMQPRGERLMQFLRWLNCVSMRREKTGAHLYTVQLRRVADFDRACRVTNIKFGDLKASITPVYKFEECPPELKTKYSERKTIVEGTKSNTAEKTSENSSKKQETVDKSKNQSIETNKIVVTKNAAVAKKTDDTSKTSDTKTMNKIVDKSMPAQNKPQATATKPQTTPTKAPTKTAPVGKSAAPNKLRTDNKTTQTKQKPQATKATEKPVGNQTSKPAQKVPVTSKPNKPATKVTPKKETKQNNDFDELDDEDILALMSNAIVLDECSGSEED